MTEGHKQEEQQGQLSVWGFMVILQGMNPIG
jgi:hypothetical protein